LSRFLPAPVASLPLNVIALLIGLSLFGALVLYSAADGALHPWALPHLIQCAVFLVMALVIRTFRLETINALVVPAYLACLGLLILVEVIGQVGGGAQRWISIGPLTLQPSELVRIAIILALAKFYSAVPPSVGPTWNGTWPALLVMGIPAALVLIQPDLDAAVVLVVGGAAVMFLAGLPLRFFALAAAAAAVVAPLAYVFVLEDYQRTRLGSFLNPEADPLGAGYHAIQAKIAIGSAGLFGKGFLQGTQGHLEFLPEHHTDLVFATLVEEWGLVGGLALLLAYFWLLRWGHRVAAAAPSRFGKLAAGGLTITFFFYVAMHVLTATAVTPIMGIPLPLISHGGSAKMTIMLLIGLLMAIERDTKRRQPTSALH
jgi:rod shape determining protein RodA